MSEMIEVSIDSIRVSLMSQQRIVILREKNAERYLPIWIGVYEAESITIALQEVEVARPLTHDLLKMFSTSLTPGSCASKSFHCEMTLFTGILSLKLTTGR